MAEYLKGDYEKAIDVLAKFKVCNEDKINSKQVELIDIVGCMLTEAKERLYPETQDLDVSIRNFFDSLTEIASEIKNEVFTNLRNVADNPAYIFTLLKSYLLNYTRAKPEIAYLEEKRKAIIKFLNEIQMFGYHSREENAKAINQALQK